MASTHELGRVARLYYEHGMTHQQIADLLGCSRIRITRLLAQAKEQGIVQVSISTAATLFADEEAQLSERYGLERVWIAPGADSLDATRESVAVVVAHVLRRLICQDMVIAVALSKTLAGAVAKLPPERLGICVVPATGTRIGEATGASSFELALELARRLGGRAAAFPVPIYIQDRQLALSFRQEPGVKKMLKQAVRAELLLMGIGSAEEDGGLMDDMISDEDRLQVIQDGAAGNAGAHFFDDHGRLIHTSVTDHLITADFDDLLAIPRRLGVAVGAARARALHAAFVGGLVTMCVLDHETARAVLAL